MEYLNYLPRNDRQDRKRPWEYIDATALIADRLTFRRWQLLCAVSLENIVLWSLAAWGLPWESDAYQSKQFVLSGLFLAASAFRSIFPRAGVWLSLAIIFV